ncbi:MAG: type I-E CRISPR-associated protein Cas6/Cse3/CasE [Gammaproteobacteria bacterium]|nr:type I-E CRISPR-associated protein Cas6/Cse3/CasE [Gammaproteobacteria bacterium]
MIASALHLSRADVKALKITDAYSLHIAIYSLFDDVRSPEDKQKSIPSGILYADKGGDFHGRKILMLSNRQPNIPEHGELSIKKIADSFLDYENYRFEVVMNPTKRENQNRKIIALRKREDIADWFITKAPQWGFTVSPEHLEIREIEVKRFEKKKGGQTVTQGQAKLIGRLTVTDKIKFVQSFQNGIGRGRAFGCGLLQVVPF